METISAMQKTAMVIPTLKRGGPCCRNILEVVGVAYEGGMIIDLGGGGGGSNNSKGGSVMKAFRFDEHLPKHPFICKPLWPSKQVLENDEYNGINHLGPAAGQVSEKRRGRGNANMVVDRCPP